MYNKQHKINKNKITPICSVKTRYSIRGLIWLLKEINNKIKTKIKTVHTRVHRARIQI